MLIQANSFLGTHPKKKNYKAAQRKKFYYIYFYNFKILATAQKATMENLVKLPTTYCEIRQGYLK